MGKRLHDVQCLIVRTGCIEDSVGMYCMVGDVISTIIHVLLFLLI